jgi:uncharacterized DUF497 family protein
VTLLLVRVHKACHSLLVEFTWDPKKAEQNIRDHEGVTFEEARTVFEDPFAQHKLDADILHEIRIRTIGQSLAGRTLFVVSLEIEDGEIARIVSARKATPKERRDYEKAKRKTRR